MVDRVGVPVEGLDRGEVVPLALGRRPDGAGLLDGGPSRPVPSADGGPARGLARQVMAIPQWAMAQPGSKLATAVNASRAGSNQKEWRSATARLNSCWAAGLQDVAKWTCPIWSDWPSCP